VSCRKWDLQSYCRSSDNRLPFAIVNGFLDAGMEGGSNYGMLPMEQARALLVLPVPVCPMHHRQ
jgi:hypothetical protein